MRCVQMAEEKGDPELVRLTKNLKRETEKVQLAQSAHDAALEGTYLERIMAVAQATAAQSEVAVLLVARLMVRQGTPSQVERAETQLRPVLYPWLAPPPRSSRSQRSG